ncbi:NAD(P)/FAD-dependent oxidoreductase [Roseiarcaceae bacterium H3SJ34-1]|uniref:flavin monoamine oxidase family protein n=1 Tax=Terripilifer ovatus TaxID=3032367 RepID=UPI003AB98792|nr:NAD(P)/FAD-dependent oxidoreductase [Roseiarcaceae bacterium H3SJ34-1]
MTLPSGDLTNDVDVVVIGAGAAGVAAGQALAKAGVSFLVIEARSRPGGRAWTSLVDAGGASYPVDMGCGWLHSADRNPLVAIARDLGLTVDETIPPWQREISADGFSAQQQREFRRAQELFYARLEKAAGEPQDRPAADLLEPGSPWTPLMHAISTYVNGVELDRLSVKDFDNYHDTEINYRVVEGYGTLIARHGAALPIIYDCPVQTVDHSGTRIRVTCANGAVAARAVIVTVPTNLIAQERIVFTPALPDKLDAAANLPLGQDDKLFLSVDRAEDLPDNSRLFGSMERAATGNYHLRPFGRPLIEGYYGGACARDLEKEGIEGFAAFAREELVSMLGSVWRDRLKPLAVSGWAQDSFATGSYSHALPGHWDKRAVLAAPVNERLFFAGEATSPHFFSTAHGAYESGERAAQEALAGLKIAAEGPSR